MIAAPPHERRYRNQVYNAERQASQEDGQAVDFHVVNRLELQLDWKTVMPAQCRVLYQRDERPH